MTQVVTTSHSLLQASPVELEPRPSSIPSEAPEKQQGPGGDGPNRPRPQIKWPQQRSFAEVLLDKSLDTVGDVLMHAKRSFEELPTTRSVEKKDWGLDIRAEMNMHVVCTAQMPWMAARSLVQAVDSGMLSMGMGMRLRMLRLHDVV